ncbi:hypothetical protein [Bacillus xiapuensis]|uniref:Uncharacterized protein n=1 Tax=Bacillus xiapuensis TaxID=2014075 RepID=A0ABU6N8D0_9BACI|nr:hypothetical protein [Bacillus xiapuensis]
MLANEAIEHLEKIISDCQQALKELGQGNKRRSIGLIDEIEHDAEAAKWLLINQVIDEEGEF